MTRGEIFSHGTISLLIRRLILEEERLLEEEETKEVDIPKQEQTTKVGKKKVKAQDEEQKQYHMHGPIKVSKRRGHHVL